MANIKNIAKAVAGFFIFRWSLKLLIPVLAFIVLLVLLFATIL